MFEHGVMIWDSSEDYILILFELPSDPAWQIRRDSYVAGMPVEDPTIVPPPGFLEPERGFGLVWRNEVSIRDQLGWATAPEQGYTGYVQIDVVSSARYVQGAAGEVYVLPLDQRWWGQIN